jgi:hypothetical protein
MRTLSCKTCGAQFQATRSDARYCSTRCRVRAHRGTRVTAIPPVMVDELVASVQSELAELGLVESAVGQQAITMATLLGSAMSGHASISRELSRLMDEAKAGAVRQADPLEELRKRRERRRASASGDRSPRADN